MLAAGMVCSGDCACGTFVCGDCTGGVCALAAENCANATKSAAESVYVTDRMICSLRWSDTPRAIGCPSCGENSFMDANGSILPRLELNNTRSGVATSEVAARTSKVEAQSQPCCARIAAFDRILRRSQAPLSISNTPDRRVTLTHQRMSKKFSRLWSTPPNCAGAS